MGAVGRGRWGEGVERGERRLYRRMVARRRKVALGKIVGGYRETEEGLTVQDAERVEGKEREREGEREGERGTQADRQTETHRDRDTVQDRGEGSNDCARQGDGETDCAIQGEGETDCAIQGVGETDRERQGEWNISGARCTTGRGRDSWCKAAREGD